MEEQFDLDAYLDRIGYSGKRTPELDTFIELHRLHVQTFPFENINSLMGWPVSLDIMSLQSKFLVDGRGGYCYEQNLLFKAVLEALGFTVTGLAARVMMDRPPESRPPRSHMLLKVDLDGTSYIADTGFGGMSLATPIRLVADEIQTTSHETRRLIKDSDEYIMQAEVRGEWKTLYRFGLAPYFLSDYEVYNWYICSHPNSHFTKGLIVARVAPTGRYTLRNNDLAFHDLKGETERKLLTTADDLRNALKDIFLIKIPDDDQFEQRLRTFAAAESV